MEPSQVQQLIEAGLPGAQVEVTRDGSHFDARVVSTQFNGLNSVKRHQKVFATLGEHITSGTLHALNIHPYTPEEWAAQGMR